MVSDNAKIQLDLVSFTSKICYKFDMADSFILISGLWRAKKYFSKNVSEVVWLNV